MNKEKSLYQYVIENMNKIKFDNIYYVIANKEHIYEINLIGGIIIEDIESGIAVKETVEKLNKIYNVKPEDLKRDVTNFIVYLQKIGILTYV